MGSQQTSSTTGTAMIALVRADYNDTSTSYFSSAEMLQFLNDGVLDIVNKSRCYQTTEDIDLIADTIEYDIVSEYVDVVTAQYFDGTNYLSLKPGSPSNVGLSIDEADTDAPVYWYEFSGKIGVYPSLSTVTTQIVKLYLIKRPEAIATGSTILTPAIYDPDVKLYMLARMALKDKNFSLYTSIMNQYMRDLGVYRADLQEEPKQ